MYRGFKLATTWNDDSYYEEGLSVYNQNIKEVKRTLDQFLLEDGSIEGKKIQENWFQQIDSHVFISHSHKDKNTAVSLAGLLSKVFGIKSFIDSCIWGYAEDLLRLIDDKYCLNSDGGTYNYQKRNYSTSHVHVMLQSALSMMIDKAECLLFLNTPNSVTTSGVVNQTYSPWIYSEIAMTRIIRPNIPRRRWHEEKRTLSKGEYVDESLKVKYELDLSHLHNLSINDLSYWIKQRRRYLTPEDALDGLYDLKPINGSNIGLIYG